MFNFFVLPLEEGGAMLGYVRIYKPELKVKEYETYRGFYCSLCKALGKEYGIFSRLLLSYDVTFLVLTLIAVRNETPRFKPGRCPFNLAKKCNYCQSSGEIFSYAAAITVILFYYKVKDNISDSRFFKKLLMYLILPYAALKRKKAIKKYAQIESEVASAMQQQSKVEKEKTADFDKAADGSAKALGKIFAFEGGEKEEALYKFGYFVGRWVYLTDAADDLEKDLKNGSYNVFSLKFGLKKGTKPNELMLAQMKETLNASLSGAASAYEKLEISILFPIVENIIFDSMTAVIEKTTGKYQSRKETAKNERSL